MLAARRACALTSLRVAAACVEPRWPFRSVGVLACRLMPEAWRRTEPMVTATSPRPPLADRACGRAFLPASLQTVSSREGRRLSGNPVRVKGSYKHRHDVLQEARRLICPPVTQTQRY